MKEERAISESTDMNAEDLDAVEAPDEQEEKEEIPAGASAEAAVLKDQLLRTLADFENYKRRTQSEYANVIARANETLLVDILPVIDDVERAIKASKELSSEDSKVQQFVQGFEIIYKKLMKNLENRGLKAMESVGKPFDVNLHEALMQADVQDKEPNTIIDELEKGYFLNDRVIRHAKVIVSK